MNVRTRSRVSIALSLIAATMLSLLSSMPPAAAESVLYSDDYGDTVRYDWYWDTYDDGFSDVVDITDVAVFHDEDSFTVIVYAVDIQQYLPELLVLDVHTSAPDPGRSKPAEYTVLAEGAESPVLLDSRGVTCNGTVSWDTVEDWVGVIFDDACIGSAEKIWVSAYLEWEYENCSGGCADRYFDYAPDHPYDAFGPIRKGDPAPPPPPPPAPSHEGTFSDDDDSKFQDEIEALVDAGVTNGCAPEKFCPDAFVTRAQMATFLDRALDLPPGEKGTFSDVSSGSTHAGAIASLAAAGVTAGCAPWKFCPNDFVTRAQMATFMDRALDLPAAPKGNPFWDDDGLVHEGAIERFANAGVTKGCATGRYCPHRFVTREQMAAFLYRAGLTG